MGQIPEFTRTVLPDTATGSASIGVARAQHDINAAQIGEARHQALDINSMMMEYRTQEAMAKNATWVNEAAMKNQMDTAVLQEQMRRGRQGNPANFAKDFDKELEKQNLEQLKAAPSEAARMALKQSLGHSRAQAFQSNVSWSHERQVSLFAASSEKAADMNDMAAYQAGLNGGEFEPFKNNAHANMISASTYAAPEAAAAFGMKRQQTAATNYVDGISQTDPIAALKKIDDPEFRKNFHDADGYSKLREAIQHRAFNLPKIIAEKQVLGVLQKENSIFTESFNSPKPYAELEAEMSKQPFSASARAYILHANGYKTADGEIKLSAADQLTYKAKIYDEILYATSKEDLSSKDISALQEKIYSGMNNKALTEKEGIVFLNQLLAPAIEKKSEYLEDFQSGKYNPFMDNLGFDAIKTTFDEQFASKIPEGEEAGDLTILRDNANKVKLFDYYREALEGAAKQKGIEIGKIPDMPSSDRRMIYKAAQDQAKELYLREKYPEIPLSQPLPNTIINSDGESVFTGAQTGSKPDASVKAGAKMMKDAKGNRAWVYPDGRVEEIK